MEISSHFIKINNPPSLMPKSVLRSTAFSTISRSSSPLYFISIIIIYPSFPTQNFSACKRFEPVKALLKKILSNRYVVKASHSRHFKYFKKWQRFLRWKKTEISEKNCFQKKVSEWLSQFYLPCCYFPSFAYLKVHSLEMPHVINHSCLVGKLECIALSIKQ